MLKLQVNKDAALRLSSGSLDASSGLPRVRSPRRPHRVVGREGNMTWDWSSPVAIGLFAMMAGIGLVLLGVAIAIVTGRAKVSDLRRQ